MYRIRSRRVEAEPQTPEKSLSQALLEIKWTLKELDPSINHRLARKGIHFPPWPNKQEQEMLADLQSNLQQFFHYLVDNKAKLIQQPEFQDTYYFIWNMVSIFKGSIQTRRGGFSWTHRRQVLEIVEKFMDFLDTTEEVTQPIQTIR